MRYTVIVKYDKKEISFKGSKYLDGEWELKDFLKMVREQSGITDQMLHMKTDISPKRIKMLESGEVEYTIEDIETLKKVFKLPRKITQLLENEKPLWAKRLVEIRSQNHFTQQQISEKLGIAQTTYAGYETGKHEPDITTMLKLADIYKTDLNYLMGRY